MAHTDLSKLNWAFFNLVVLFVLLITAVVFFWDTMVAHSETIRNLTLTAAGIAGVPFLILQTYIAYQKVQVDKVKQISERIGDTAERLSSVLIVPRYEESVTEPGKWDTWEKEIVDTGVRHAALLSLVRIAGESGEDCFPFMEMVVQYIERRSKESFKMFKLANTALSDAEISRQFFPAADVDAAFTALERLYLTGHYSFVMRDRNLNIKNAKLQNSDLKCVEFSWIDFTESDLSHSNFSLSKFENCWFESTQLINVEMQGAKFNGSVLIGANLSDARNLDIGMLTESYGVNTPNHPLRTELPEELESQRHKLDKYWYTDEYDEEERDLVTRRRVMAGFSAWQAEREARLKGPRLFGNRNIKKR